MAVASEEVRVGETAFERVTVLMADSGYEGEE